MSEEGVSREASTTIPDSQLGPSGVCARACVRDKSQIGTDCLCFLTPTPPPSTASPPLYPACFLPPPPASIYPVLCRPPPILFTRVDCLAYSFESFVYTLCPVSSLPTYLPTYTLPTPSSHILPPLPLFLCSLFHLFSLRVLPSLCLSIVLSSFCLPLLLFLLAYLYSVNRLL